jgi:uncharacterized protein (TIGR03000 family)
MLYQGAATQNRRSPTTLIARTKPAPKSANGSGISSSVSLVANVPSDAKIYINEKLTKSTGSLRTFVSNNLKQGSEYQFTVRAEIKDARGKLISETQQVSVVSGETKSVTFILKNSPVMLAATSQQSRPTER